jgi:aspartate-semialdehyde dehydrogenase
MISQHQHIAVVGATGAVGREALAIVQQRGHPAHRIVALASSRSAGTFISYGETRLVVRELTHDAFQGVDVALFCASSDIAKLYAHDALAAGALVVDNSSAFRADPRVPLVVPEINADAIGSSRLIANPNCSTIIMLLALQPLHERFGVRRITVATYQAVSGAGASAMEELREQAGHVLAGYPAVPKVFREQTAFNVFSHNSSVNLETGLNGEEAKMIAESRKIWSLPHLAVSPTCVRVPVFRAHTQAITVELGTPATLSAVRAAYARAAGVRVVDDRATNDFPTPLKASGHDDVLVGRLREDPGEPTGAVRRFCLMVAGDQLRKGAALNAIQIADVVSKLRKEAA